MQVSFPLPTSVNTLQIKSIIQCCLRLVQTDRQQRNRKECTLVLLRNSVLKQPGWHIRLCCSQHNIPFKTLCSEPLLSLCSALLITNTLQCIAYYQTSVVHCLLMQVIVTGNVRASEASLLHNGQIVGKLIKFLSPSVKRALSLLISPCIP